MSLFTSASFVRWRWSIEAGSSYVEETEHCAADTSAKSWMKDDYGSSTLFIKLNKWLMFGWVSFVTAMNLFVSRIANDLKSNVLRIVPRQYARI